ncbi:MAG: VWA domain-containing protein [Patescibacteria group bacterium]
MNTRENQELSTTEIEIYKGVESVGALFGLQGIKIDISPGNKWMTARTDKGITVFTNPNGLARSSKEPITPEEVLYGTAHEVGHAVDMLDPAYDILGDNLKQSDNFFWNIIDDTVINTRLNAAPLLNRIRVPIYKKLFPKLDITDTPQHIQLMYGILLGKMAPEVPYVFDPEINTLVYSLRNYELKSGSSVDIIDSLTSMRTDLQQRIRLSELYIKPLYDQLLKEDKESKKEKHEKGEPTDGSENEDEKGSEPSQDDSFKEEYDKYEEANHVSTRPAKSDEEKTDTEEAAKSEPSDDKGDDEGKGKGDDNDEGDDGGNGDDESSSGGDDEAGEGESIAKAVKTSIEEYQEAAKASEEKSETSGDKPEVDEEGEPIDQKVAGYIREEMGLTEWEANDYFESLNKYRREINAIADLFLLLAAKSDVMNSPRFDHRADTEGKRLHPLKLSRAALQIITRKQDAIWQPISQRGKRQEIDFSGLDIHFLVDGSQSMQGNNAIAAASSSLILLEGLELAKQRAKVDSGNFREPDVRAQIVAFGSSHTILSPLSTTIGPKVKGNTYSQLLRPHSRATYVTQALEEVPKAAEQSPSRDHLVLIVTDGEFHDHEDAIDTVNNLPESCYVIQINMGYNSEGIGHAMIEINSPDELPAQLYPILRRYVEERLI